MDKSISERAAEEANRLVAEGISPIGEKQAVSQAVDLLKRSEIAMVGSNGEDGYPQVKAMFVIDAEPLRHVWFSTNTSSSRVRQFKNNPKASLYFYDDRLFCGLLLTGTMAIVTDTEVKERLWRSGWEAYYPQGITDTEYCILRFDSQWGNFYHGLQTSSFSISNGGVV